MKMPPVSSLSRPYHRDSSSSNDGDADSLSTLTWDASYKDELSESTAPPPKSKSQDIWRRPPRQQTARNKSTAAVVSDGVQTETREERQSNTSRQTHGLHTRDVASPSIAAVHAASTPTRDNRGRRNPTNPFESSSSSDNSSTTSKENRMSTVLDSILQQGAKDNDPADESSLSLTSMTKRAVENVLTEVLTIQEQEEGENEERENNGLKHETEAVSHESSHGDSWFSRDDTDPSRILADGDATRSSISLTTTVAFGEVPFDLNNEGASEELWQKSVEPNQVEAAQPSSEGRKCQRRRMLCLAVFLTIFVLAGVTGTAIAFLLQDSDQTDDSDTESTAVPGGSGSLWSTRAPSLSSGLAPTSVPVSTGLMTTSAPTVRGDDDMPSTGPLQTTLVPSSVAQANPSLPVTVSPTTTKISPPSTVPTPILPSSLRHLVIELSPETAEYLDDPLSPQALALDYTSSMLVAPGSTGQSLQTFALATLWFVSKALETDGTMEDVWLDGSSATQMCYWEGVVCDSERHVVRLDLAFAEASWGGTLPHELSLLTHLEVLRMVGSGGQSIAGRWAGTVPSSWGRELIRLRTLELSNNQLTGYVPESFGQLSYLRELSLDGNRFSGEIPSYVGNLSSLGTLNLANNQLSGPIPSHLGRLSHLARLDAHNNQLTGLIPTEIGHSTALVDLQLQRNALVGAIPDSFSSLAHLAWLDLRDNHLSSSLPTSVIFLTKLEGLLLSKNNLEQSLPTELGTLTALRHLLLSDNRFTGTVPSSFGALIRLYELQVDGNRNLRGTLPSQLCAARRHILLDCSVECDCCTRECPG